MTLKKLGLLTAFCLTLALYGCGGGGGGSSPIAASVDPAIDLALQAENPAVFNAYTSMRSALEEVAGSTPAARVDSFMPYIASDFANTAGTPASSSLKAITLDRLTRYTINSYKFIPTAHVPVGTDTLKITTYMSINVTRKQGAVGGYPEASTVLSPGPVITWKNYGTEAAGNWKIQKGLPYLSTEISF